MSIENVSAPGGHPRRAQLLAAGLFGAGIAHFVKPAFFDSIVPPVLPGSARTYTYVSGVAELGVGAVLAVPRTRRVGGLLAALLFIAVYPANIQHTVDSLGDKKASRGLKIGSIARLPLQIPMVIQALRVARGK